MERRSRQVLCRCRLHCTIYNRATGLYEGGGHFVSRSTRDSHARDDQLRQSTGSPGTAASPSQKWLNVYRAEVEILRTFPITSRRAPLVFRRNPALSGNFVTPADHEMLTPNDGIHALTNDPANQAYLEIETRYCELCTFIQQMDATDEQTHLLDLLYSELRRLIREKQVQWSEQRSVVGKYYVNTGEH